MAVNRLSNITVHIIIAVGDADYVKLIVFLPENCTAPKSQVNLHFMNTLSTFLKTPSNEIVFY